MDAIVQRDDTSDTRSDGRLKIGRSIAVMYEPAGGTMRVRRGQVDGRRNRTPSTATPLKWSVCVASAALGVIVTSPRTDCLSSTATDSLGKKGAPSVDMRSRS